MIREWARRDRRIAAKCYERIELLGEQGHELRRPAADLLRDGVYELRIAFSGVQYRLLYFFSGGRAVLATGVPKEDRVPSNEIDRALRFLKEYEKNPEARTYVREE